MEILKRIPTELTVFDYKVVFTYETRKGYYREQERSIKGISKEDVTSKFKYWAKKQRTMTNVNILGMVEIRDNRQKIEL